MPSKVNARIPLSLLEAIRRIDTPDDQVDTEYVPELRNKRLGLSDTVYTQIRRYNDAMNRGQQVPFAEAEVNPALFLETPDSGGHVGFVDFANGLQPWSERRVAEFFARSE